MNHDVNVKDGDVIIFNGHGPSSHRSEEKQESSLGLT